MSSTTTVPPGIPDFPELPEPFRTNMRRGWVFDAFVSAHEEQLEGRYVRQTALGLQSAQALRDVLAEYADGQRSLPIDDPNAYFPIPKVAPVLRLVRARIKRNPALALPEPLESPITITRKPWTDWKVTLIDGEGFFPVPTEVVFRTTLANGKECEQFSVLERRSDVIPVQIRMYKNGDVEVSAAVPCYVMVHRRQREVELGLYDYYLTE